MERCRTWIAVLAFLAVGVWASQSRIALVLEVRGQSSADVGGRIRPLRTLQALPLGARVTVGSGGRVRLAFLTSGHKETLEGPIQVTIGRSSSGDIGGEGSVSVQRPSGSRTLIPRSENLRRMGGARHAYQEMEALDLIAQLPDDLHTYKVRFDPKPRISEFPPALRRLEPGRQIFWIGGVEPYTVALRRDDGRTEIERTDYDSSFLWPPLEGGHAYTLQVTDSEGARSDPMEFYLLSAAEAEEVERDLADLASGQLPAESIAYLEARGLWEDALAATRTALQDCPDDVGLLTALGRLQLLLGRSQEAESSLERALELER